jgi:hypothetical protein
MAKFESKLKSLNISYNSLPSELKYAIKEYNDTQNSIVELKRIIDNSSDNAEKKEHIDAYNEAIKEMAIIDNDIVDEINNYVSQGKNPSKSKSGAFWVLAGIVGVITLGGVIMNRNK